MSKIVLESSEPLENSLNNKNKNGFLIINEFVIKKKPGFTYSVHTERVHYQDGDYLRTSLKEVGFSDGEPVIRRTTYFHKKI